MNRYGEPLRPPAMWVDALVCIECGICEELSPGIRASENRIEATPGSLEAMAACPTGAIRWLEEGESK